MKDLDLAAAATDALFATPLLIVVLAISRGWTRGVARGLTTGADFSRDLLTIRLIEPMSWRLAVFFGLALVLFYMCGRHLFSAALFSVIAYPLGLLNVWLHARRFTQDAFIFATVEEASARNN